MYLVCSLQPPAYSNLLVLGALAGGLANVRTKQVVSTRRVLVHDTIDADDRDMWRAQTPKQTCKRVSQGGVSCELWGVNG